MKKSTRVKLTLKRETLNLLSDASVALDKVRGAESGGNGSCATQANTLCWTLDV